MKGRLRILFKADRDSSIGRGAYMLAEHFESPVVELLAAVARQTEKLLPFAKELHVTEGWRPQRVAGQRDLHTELKAFDFTIEFVRGIRASEDEYRRVAEATRAVVGDSGYDFLVHGEGSSTHIHAEYDPK